MTSAVDRALIHQSLDNASENGYDVVSLDPDEVARDMTWCDSHAETMPYDEVRQLVAEWQTKKRAQLPGQI